MSSKTENDCLCEEPVRTTKCDCDRVNNMWVEGGDPSKGSGICLLDTAGDDLVIYSLQHNPNAAKDLLRVTSDPHLRELAMTVPLLSTTVEEDELMKEGNRNNEAGSIPFYAIFRGQPPFAQ